MNERIVCVLLLASLGVGCRTRSAAPAPQDVTVDADDVRYWYCPTSLMIERATRTRK